MKKAQFGLIGLAVMGQNLARNIANKKINTVVYNRTAKTMQDFVMLYGGNYLKGETGLKNFVTRIERPRKIMLMIKAGDAVDEMIESLLPHLNKGDVIIDGGNSTFYQSYGRYNDLAKKNIHFIGCGVSGGEEGALKGPSLMPGGSKAAYKLVRPIFEKIAAKDFAGKPCVTHIGPNASGHFIKMVHNGIEYSVMQLIAESYEILKTVYKLTPPQIAKIFESYNKGKLNSFLFEIVVSVLSKKDDITEKGFLIDKILDVAQQKGTGKWTTITALDWNVSIPTITVAVDARILSMEKNIRVKLSKLYKKSVRKSQVSLVQFTYLLEDALYASVLSCYAQGYHFIQEVSDKWKWNIDLAEVSRIWEGGCIIRSVILNFLHKAYGKTKKQQHMFAIPEVMRGMKTSLPSLRKVSAIACEQGMYAPAMFSALSYFEGMTSARTSANVIQGLRDFFGAHTYERTDKKGVFHTEWNNSL